MNVRTHEAQFARLKSVLHRMLLLEISIEQIYKAVDEFLDNDSKIVGTKVESIIKIGNSIPVIYENRPKQEPIIKLPDKIEKRGRKPGLSPKAKITAISALKLYEEKMLIADILESLNIKSRATLYVYLRWAQANKK